jgi:hypothetical protein
MRSGVWDDGSAEETSVAGVMEEVGFTLRSLGLVIYGESGSRTLSCCLLGVPATACRADVMGNDDVGFRVDLRTGAGRSAVYSPGGGMFSCPRPGDGSWTAVDGGLVDLCAWSVVMVCRV